MAIWNERIKQKRIEKGITLAQIADSLNVTEATAQRYESGSIKSVPYEHMCTYAKLLNCTPQYLMGWAKEEENSVLDYYDKTLNEIITSIKKMGYTISKDNSPHDGSIIIKNKKGKIIKSTTENELVNQYEKLRSNNMNQTVTSLIWNEKTSVSNRTDLYIHIFESYGYQIQLGLDTVLVTDSHNNLYTFNRGAFMSMIQRCHKDIIYNFDRLIDEYKDSEKTDCILNAAHKRTDINFTEEDRLLDEAMLNEEDD